MSISADGDDDLPELVWHDRSSADARSSVPDDMFQGVYGWSNGPGMLDTDLLLCLLGISDVGQLAEGSAESTLRASHVELVFNLEASLQLEKQHELNPCGTFMLFCNTIVTIA